MVVVVVMMMMMIIIIIFVCVLPGGVGMLHGGSLELEY
jgi:hypothetical protein